MKALKISFLVVIFCMIPMVFAAQVRNEDSLITQRIQRVEQENRDLRVKIDYLEKLYDRRFDDFTKWLGILIALLAGGVILAGVNANAVARKQAIEELHTLQEKITDMERQSSIIGQQLNAVETRLQIFQQISTSESGADNEPNS